MARPLWPAPPGASPLDPRVEASRVLAGRKLDWVVRIVLALPVVTLVMVLLWASRTAGAPDGADTDTAIRAAARGAAGQWVAEFALSGALPPGAAVLGLAEETHDTTRADGTDTARYRWVVEASGAYYQVRCVVEIRGADILAVGSPAIEPYALSWGPGTPGAWDGLGSAAVTAEVRAAVEAWAAAYSSGSPEKLHQAVHDPDPARHYTPVTGAVFGDVLVRGSAWAAGQDGDPAPDKMIVSVDIPVAWGRGAAPGPQSPTVGFDLLVTGASSASPAVVAWGAPGDGPTLEPWANSSPVAVVVATPVVTPAAPPSATAGPAQGPPGGEPT